MVVALDDLTCRSSFGNAGLVLLLSIALNNRAVVLSVVRKGVCSPWGCSVSLSSMWSPLNILCNKWPLGSLLLVLQLSVMLSEFTSISGDTEIIWVEAVMIW